MHDMSIDDDSPEYGCCLCQPQRAVMLSLVHGSGTHVITGTTINIDAPTAPLVVRCQCQQQRYRRRWATEDASTTVMTIHPPSIHCTQVIAVLTPRHHKFRQHCIAVIGLQTCTSGVVVVTTTRRNKYRGGNPMVTMTTTRVPWWSAYQSVHFCE